MRVYVESNFVVELSLRQEEVDACEEILALAVSRRVELVVPMIALLEPSETLRRRQAVMSDFATRLGENLRELERISLAGVAKGANQHLVKGFRDAINDWKPRLSAVRQSIARVARVLPLDVDLMDRAETLVFDGLMEKEPDALVLAAVIRDLTQHPALRPLRESQHARFRRSQVRVEVPRMRPVGHLLPRAVEAPKAVSVAVKG